MRGAAVAAVVTACSVVVLPAAAQAKPVRASAHKHTKVHHVRARIRHVRAQVKTAALTGGAASPVAGLKEISYYPAQNPWGGMWYVWQPATIDADMAKIAALGANTVRIFVQPATFGYPTPSSTYLARFAQFLSIAAAHGLKVQVTLFDLWSSYTDVTGSEQWASALLAPFYGDPRIAAVELQNEVNPTDPQAMSWVRTMIPVIRADSGRPVTVSTTGWDMASATSLYDLEYALGGVTPDFYDIHYYGSPVYMQSAFTAAKALAGSTPLLIGETGYSTDPSNTYWVGSGQTTSLQELAQSYFLAYVEQAAKSAGLPPAGVWTLNDFPALGGLSATEQHFGLYRLDGTAKPGAAELKSLFTGW